MAPDRGGLTRKGVAERLSIPQARVRDRLQLLELDQELLPKVADGTIPLAAVRPLAELGKVHAELPAQAVAQVLEGEGSDDYYGEQWTWKDVQQNALEVAVADEDELPAGIYLAYRSYELDCFTLTDKAQEDLRKFAKLRGVPVEEVSTLRFEGSEVEQARALGAAHEVGRGLGTLIAGQDVADQLACDAIVAALKEERARRREAKRSAEQDGRAEAETAAAAPEPVDEEAAKEERRRERERAEEERRAAVAHNLELGAQVAKLLALVISGRTLSVRIADALGRLRHVAEEAVEERLHTPTPRGPTLTSSGRHATRERRPCGQDDFRASRLRSRVFGLRVAGAGGAETRPRNCVAGHAKRVPQRGEPTCGQS